MEDKTRRAKERPKDMQFVETKEGRDLVPFVVRNYFTHNPLMLHTCKLWNLIVIGGLDQTSFANVIFHFIAEAKAHQRTILTCYFKKWIQKDKDKWSPNCLSWKRRAHSLMTQSISHPSASCISMAIGIKWCPSWSLLYLWILTMVLSFAATPIDQLMTLLANIFRVRSITITSTTKT